MQEPPREPAATADTTPTADPPVVLVRTWGFAVAGILAAKLLSFVEPSGLLAANLAGVAAVLFVTLPDRRLRARGEGWERYGLPGAGLLDPITVRAWGRGALWALATCLVVFPVFAAGFWAFSRVLPELPPALARVLAPYGAPAGLAWRAPEGLAWRIPVQLLVVALPEELFYRGWMQTSWARGAGARAGGIRVLGARLGRGFLATQALFAVGHLVVLEPWRLATFFPALLFGWLRERTGSVAAPVLVHAASNLFLATLEASFYG